MYGCEGSCLQGGAGRQQSRREIGDCRRCDVASSKACCCGDARPFRWCFPSQAHAQGTTLPPVTVEGKAPKAAKKSATKPAPKAAPQQQAAEPEPQPQTAAARDKARSEAVYNTPAAVSTAGKSELDTFGQVDTGDVLRAMPGTFTRESPQNPGVAVNIRGLEGSGRVNMMIDGVRQNFRFTGHEAQGFAYVDPALLAGVDIARGAVSTVGGAGALVGHRQPAHARRR